MSMNGFGIGLNVCGHTNDEIISYFDEIKTDNHKHISKIYLRHNLDNDKVIKSLSEMIKVNDILTELNLSDCYIIYFYHF